MSPSETFLRLRALAPRDGSATRDEAADELPPGAAVERAFGLRFGRDAEHPAPRDDDAPCAPEVDARGRVSCACAGCARWKSYLDGALGPPWPAHPQYEVLVREHVRALAAYLRRRAREPSPREPAAVVLEVGAGDGRLARHLHEPSATWTPRTPPSSRRPSCSSPSTTTPPHAADANSATTRAFRASGDPSLPNPRRGCFEWTRWSPSRTRGPQPSRRFQSLMSFCVAGNRWAWTGPPRCARGRACASTCWWARRTTGYAASRGPRGDRARVRTRAANSRTNSRTRTRTRMTRPPTQVGKPGSNPRGRRTRWTGSSAAELPEVSRGQICRTDERWWGLGGRGPSRSVASGGTRRGLGGVDGDRRGIA